MKLDGSLRLLLGIPVYAGLDATCFSSILGLQKLLAERGIGIGISVLAANPIIVDARNRILGEFLAGDWTHLLMIDSDIGFSAETVEAMLLTDRDFVACAVPLRGIQWENIERAFTGDLSSVKRAWLRYNVLVDRPEPLAPDADGLLEIDSVGAAFVLVSRSTIERMSSAFADLEYEDCGVRIPGLFNCIVENRRLYGEDLSFCKRWRSLGGKIWLYPDATLSHSGLARFTGNISHVLR